MASNKLFQNSLSIKIFLIIILVVLLQSALLFFISATQLKENLIQGEIKDTHTALISLQENLHFLLLKNEHNQVQKTISSLGVNTNLEQAFLAGDNNHVMAATQINTINKPIEKFLPSKQVENLKQRFIRAKNNLKNDVWLSKDGFSLYAVSPIILDRKSLHSLRSDRVGLIFLDIDLTWIDKQIQHELWNHILPVVYILFLAGLSLGLYFHFSVSRRIKLVNRASLNFANKHYDTRLKIVGNDEITELGQAFNSMAKQVQEHNQHLLNREKKLIQKETEQREILNSMVEGVISIDETGKILTFNHAAEQLFGYSSSEVIGDNVNLLMPLPESKKNNEYIKKYLNKGISRIIGTGREVQALDKNNHTFPIRLSVAELSKDIDGKRRFIGSCQDLRQLKHQEEQLRQSQKMEALGKLTGGIAHDYNNMLSVILGYTQLLNKKFSDKFDRDSEDSLRYIDCIKEAAIRSKKMTDKLLSFSRKRSSNAEECNINTILQNDAEMLAKSLTARIEIRMDLCESPWPIILDISEFQDMLLNMAINAQHAMPNGGILTFQTQTKTLTEEQALIYGLKSADYMYLSIQDTGIGMDKKTISKIFDPFFTTKGEQGTGLGLSQSFGFVERSGGAIHVISKLGQGTQFEIFFPRNTAKKIKKNPEQTVDSVDLTGNETLLVVDDEPILRIMLAEILGSNGYKVLLADGAEQALEMLAFNNDIRLMLSDVIMPKVDGFELAQMVIKKYPKVVVQLLSGYIDERDNNLNDQKLLENILYKPYNRHELLVRVRMLLDKKN